MDFDLESAFVLYNVLFLTNIITLCDFLSERWILHGTQGPPFIWLTMILARMNTALKLIRFANVTDSHDKASNALASPITSNYIHKSTGMLG